MANSLFVIYDSNNSFEAIAFCQSRESAEKYVNGYTLEFHAEKHGYIHAKDAERSFEAVSLKILEEDFSY